MYQALTPFKFLNNKYSGGAHMAMGLCGNPNFFGAYMAIQLSLPTVLYIKKGGKKYLFLFILFSIGLYLASSSGPMLGYVLSFILISIIFRKQYKKIIILFLIFLTICFGTDRLIKFVHTEKLNNFVPATNKVKKLEF